MELYLKNVWLNIVEDMIFVIGLLDTCPLWLAYWDISSSKTWYLIPLSFFATIQVCELFSNEEKGGPILFCTCIKNNGCGGLISRTLIGICIWEPSKILCKYEKIIRWFPSNEGC